MSVTVIICACLLAERGWMKVSQEHVTGRRATRIVVVDAGHGGVDPGKIGVDDSLEKDINLEIAERLKTILEQQDIQVVMTREEDKGLYEETASNKKAQDLKKRCSLINEGQADCAVSIHQNSYHEEYVKGAQVFYYGNSGDAERLAELIQTWLKEGVDPENNRQAKANESYYLLKKYSGCYRGMRLSFQLGGGKTPAGRGISEQDSMGSGHGNDPLSGYQMKKDCLQRCGQSFEILITWRILWIPDRIQPLRYPQYGIP